MTIGTDGVIELFPTKSGGSTFHLDLTLANPKTDPKFDVDGMNQDAPITKKTEAGVTFFSTPGDVVHYASGGAPGRTIRIGSYASGGKGKTQTHNWDERPLFLYSDKDILNSEITVYVRAHGD